MKTNSDKLTSCPFCSKPARLERINELPEVWSVDCPDDYCATFKHGNSKKEAIANWNRRPREEMLEKLEESEDELREEKDEHNELKIYSNNQTIALSHRAEEVKKLHVKMQASCSREERLEKLLREARHALTYSKPTNKGIYLVSNIIKAIDQELSQEKQA